MDIKPFIVWPALLGLIFFACNEHQQPSTQMDPEDSVISLSNEEFVLNIQKRGGAFTDFHLKAKPLNPFQWKLNPDQMPVNNQPHVFAGHFLCTGRWGEPSAGEIEQGIPHNGEVNTQWWQINDIIDAPGLQTLTMKCNAPIEKLDVQREIIVPKKGSYFIVRERFTNNLPIGRLTNVVQHATIAEPFLTKNTILCTNANRGFDQATNFAYLEDSSFLWPNGQLADGSLVDLSVVTEEKGYVTTHIFSDSIGYIIASNPDEHMAIGYIWKTSEYPWLNLWHQSKNGKPYVQGLEFGTTGLGEPYELLLENQVDFFGHNSFEYIDAKETMEKSWICFMILLPEDFGKIESLELGQQQILLSDGHTSVAVNGDFEAFDIQ